MCAGPSMSMIGLLVRGLPNEQRDDCAPVEQRRRNMTDSADHPLAGLCILVVEDDFEIAESLSIVMANLGATVVGPTATVEQARTLIESNQIDVALLDVALRQGTSAALARILRDRRCPFLFITGFSSNAMLPEDLRDSRFLRKPVSSEMMIQAIRVLANDGAERDAND